MSRHLPNENPRLRGFEKLDERLLLAFDSVYISEFMANNDSTLADEDGQFSDWIELHNPTSQPLDLAGWSLTDSPGNLRKWVLPSVIIPPGGFQIVFASGKDRRDAANKPHTNFRLSGDGEYLALVKPTNEIAMEFAPSYPTQTPDVAFGFANDGVSFINSEQTRAIHVPTADDDAHAWKHVSFEDSQWQQVVGSVGYDDRLRNPGFENGTLSHWGSRGPVSVTNRIVDATPVEGQLMAVATTLESAANRSAAEFYLGLSRSSLDAVNTGGVQRVASVKRDVTVREGSVLTLDWNYLTNDLRDGDFAFGFVSDSDSIELLADATSDLLLAPGIGEFEWQTGFRQYRHVFETGGTFTIGIGVAQAFDLEFDSAIAVDNLRIDGHGEVGQSYDTAIQTLLDERFSTLQWRQAFQYGIAQAIEELTLRIRYDDGFSAFLNGQLVASDNAPTDLAWDSSAIGPRANDQTLTYRDFSIDPSVLKSGTNTLAIQGLSAADDQFDFLLDVQLLGASTVNDVGSFLHQPTPGRHNLSEVSPVPVDYSERVIFERPAGFYDHPFVLRLSTARDATIRYTTDGSEPSAQNGIDYTQPIRINSTTTIRAVAMKDGLTSRAIGTASYLFLDDVVQQSTESALAAGFPTTWDNYEMDPDVIGASGQDLFDGKYAATIHHALRSVPTLSLVMDQDDWFGAQGLFENPFERGDQWERRTSVELLLPDGAEGFQIDAGVRIHGAASRSSDKRSLRILFRSEYGSSKLQYPLFGDGSASQFDALVLRSSASERQIGFHYIRDETARRLEQKAGNASVRGMFVHVYVNGLYWGLYNLMQRMDAEFAAGHDGGTKGEYDVVMSGDDLVPAAASGNLDAWQRLVGLAFNMGVTTGQQGKSTLLMRMQGRNADGTDDPNLENYLDVDNFIKYLIINVYVGNSDWPHQNFYMYRKRGVNSDGFRFVIWDAEFSLYLGDWVRPISDLNSGPAAILPSLLTSEAFRIRFADVAQQTVSPGGVLYVNPDAPKWDPAKPENNEPARIYAGIVDETSDAIVGESARWGDTGHPNPPFTRDEDWLPDVEERLAEFFPQRTALLLESLRADDLYRDAPAFSMRPGHSERGMTLALIPANEDAANYVTTDGSDPRRWDGSISPSAFLYTEPIVITETTHIRTRSLDGTKWSAIDGGLYTVDEELASAENLRITEIHYHPEPDGDTEFLEFANVGPDTINLEGVKVEGGVTFEFSDRQHVRLDSGERLVLVRDREAFLQVYPEREHIVAGQYEGNLSNGGEELRLLAADGTTIQQFEYHDDGDWPSLPDGGGPSLQLIAPNRDVSLGSSWRPSAVDGGTPGQPQYRAGDSNLDGLFDSSDLVQVFQRGKYEDAINGNSTFADGDWDGDGDFTTSDLVLAFQTGEYTAEVLPGQHRNADSANIASAIDAVFFGLENP